MSDHALQSFLVPQLKLCELESLSRALTRQMLYAEKHRNFTREKQILLRKLSIVEIEIIRTGGKP